MMAGASTAQDQTRTPPAVHHVAGFFGRVAVLIVCAVATSHGVKTAPESPRAVVERRFEAVRRHDVAAVAALYASDAVETSPAFCTDRFGPEGARRAYTDLFDAYPDISADEPVYVVEGNRVAVQSVARQRKLDGTMAFEVRLVNFLTVDNGRIIRDEPTSTRRDDHAPDPADGRTNAAARHRRALRHGLARDGGSA